MMLKRAAKPHNTTSNRIHVRGEDIGLRPDIAPIFVLVVHELMTNAAKYEALSCAGGQLVIDLAPSAEGLTLRWSETGGPPVAPPKREGFGTTLLSNAVPNELKGTIKIEFCDTGARVDICLPHEILSGVRSLGHTSKAAGQADTAPAHAQTGGTTHAQSKTLLIEDSFVFSLDTLRILKDAGYENMRTAMTVADGLKSVADECPDFAVLDVNLSGGETSIPIAHRLVALGVPFIFVTGYGVDGSCADIFPDIPVIQKPLRRSALEHALEGILL